MSFASKLRKVLVAAVSGALALSTISVMPASAAGPVVAAADAVAYSDLGTNATLSDNGEVTLPEGVTDLSADVNFVLSEEFLTANLGKTVGISRTVTAPDNTVIVSGSNYTIYGNTYFNFCEAGYTNCKNNSGVQPPVESQVILANQVSGSAQLYTNLYRMSGPNEMGPRSLPAGTYKIDVKLTVDGAPVAVDGTDVSIGQKYVRYTIRDLSTYTVGAGISSININQLVCLDSAKLDVGDVITPTFYLNDVAQNISQWDIDFDTRAREDAPNPRQQGAGPASTTATVTQDDIDYGLAVRMFKGIYSLTAGTVYNWGTAVVDQDGNDVTGSCKPSAPGKPSLAYDSISNRVTATITTPAKFAEGTRCDFYKSTDLSTVVGTGYAWSNMPNTPATCTLNNGSAGTSYVVKAIGTYYNSVGDASPASDAVLIPAPGISVDPAVSGVTDVAGKVSVVSSDVAHFSSNFGNRIVADGLGGAYRAYMFSTSGSCPPNCGPPTYSYKLRQSNASGYVAGFAGTGTVEFAPTGQGGGNMLVGWYGAAGDKWTLGSTTIDGAANAGQIELLQGTNSSATTTSIKVNKAEAQATCDELGAGYTTASMPNSISINGYLINAPTAKQLFVLNCYKTVTMSDNVTTANLPNPVLVTIDGNNALTLVKALGEHSASVNSSQVSFSVNPAPAAGGVMLTALVTKKNVTAYTNMMESAGTVAAREIVRFKADLTSTATTNGWTSAGTSISNEPAMLQPQVNNGDYFVMQRTNAMPSPTFKIAKVTSSGAVGSMVDVTIDKAAELVGANLAFPIGAQSASASAVQVVANAPGMGMGAATSISVISVNTSTGAAKAGEIVKYTTSGQSYLLINNFMVDPSTSDVHWWFADAAAGVDKLSIYKWRDHLYVKPSGPVPAVTSKNLEYATNTPAAGTKVTFTGTNLNLATAVKFGTVAATLGTKTATSLEVTVPAGTGTVAITIESANGNAAAGNFTYVGANKVAQTVTLDAGANTATVGDADRSLSATVAMTGYTAVASLTYSSTTASVCTVTGNKLKFVAKGTCSVKATQAGSSWAAEGVATKDITVVGSAPVVSTQVTGKATNTPAAGTKVTIAGSNLGEVDSVKFGAVTATIGTRSATSLEVTVPAGTKGTVDINLLYSAGTLKAGTFEYVGADKIAQTVTLDAGANTATVGDADRTLSATVAMTGYTAVTSLTYSSNTASVCTVTGNKLKFVKKGTCTVKATQAGSSWAAEGVDTKSITVAGTAPVVSAQVSGKATNTPDAGLKLTIAGSNLGEVDAVKFGTVTATIGTRSATSLEVTVPAGTKGTVDVNLVYSGGTVKAGTFEYVGATKVAQVVALNAGATTAAVGDADRTLSATVSMTGYTAVASLTYSSTTASVCTVTGTKLKFVAKGTCTVKATQAGSSWAAEGVDTKSITVVSLDAPVLKVRTGTGAKVVAGDGFFVYVSSDSKQDATVASLSPSVCSVGLIAENHVLNLRSGNCKLLVSVAGTANWSSASKIVTFKIVSSGTSSTQDAGNIGQPVILGSSGKKQKVLSETVSWRKSSGELRIASQGIWVGPIKATATFKVGSKSYSCTVEYGTTKAVSSSAAKTVKTFASASALCSGKSAAEKAALAALKRLAAPTLVKIVVVRELRNPTKYTTKGQKITRAVYVTIG